VVVSGGFVDSLSVLIFSAIPRPVIASEIGGLRETVGDAGLMCQPGSSEDLARCMREVLHDRALLPALGRKGRERARSLFLRERMIAEHAHIYRSLEQTP